MKVVAYCNTPAVETSVVQMVTAYLQARLQSPSTVREDSKLWQEACEHAGIVLCGPSWKDTCFITLEGA